MGIILGHAIGYLFLGTILGAIFGVWRGVKARNVARRASC
jgi:hypothetical protein